MYESFLDFIGQKDARFKMAVFALLPWIRCELTAVGKPGRLDQTNKVVEHAVLRVLQWRHPNVPLRKFLDAIGQKDVRVVKAAIALLPWISCKLTAVGKPQAGSVEPTKWLSMRFCACCRALARPVTTAFA